MMTTPPADGLTNGYDVGDLLSDIDRQIGETVQRTAHRYLPIQRAKLLRGEVTRYIGDAIVRHDAGATDPAQKTAA